MSQQQNKWDLTNQRTVASKLKLKSCMVLYQIDVFKDFSGAVHLPEDDDHLVVYELLKLPQVTHHLHLQLCSDLGKGQKRI